MLYSLLKAQRFTYLFAKSHVRLLSFPARITADVVMKDAHKGLGAPATDFTSCLNTSKEGC